MAIVPMQKVAVVAHKSKQEELLQILQHEGVLEIVNIREPTQIDHSEVHFRSAELDFAVQVLTEVASKEILATASKSVSEEQILRAAHHTDVKGIIDELHKMAHEDTELHRLRESLTKAVPEQKMENIDDLNAAESPAFFNKTKRLKQDLSHYGLTLAAKEKDHMQDSETIAMKHKEIEQKLETNRMRRVQLSSELPNLVHMQQFIRWLDQKQAAREAMVNTSHTVTLFGWIKAKMFHQFERKLSAEIAASAVLPIRADEGEEPPVALENPTWIKPFESVTTLYGLPLASEYDPTPLLAPFFILFFGLCLTDADYGLVLAGLMGAYLWKKKLSIQQAPLWWLLFLSGLLTVIVSVPFGGWFGMTPQQAPSFMTVDTNGDGVADLFKGQIWNLGETKGISFFQNLALALGLIHLSFGIFLAGFAKWKNGDIAGAFWSDFTSLFLIGSAIFYAAAPADIKQMAFYVLIASLVLMVWGKGSGKKWFLRPLFGLLGLLNFALGMLSNTLSYLRLLALGLVTGALALAVNLVAQQISSLFPLFIGIPIMIIILTLGHIVNIALNTLGAFIHSGRLQFVEFFSQFFEGGGRPFTPFSRSVTSA